MEEDIRWKQRLVSYKKSLTHVHELSQLAKQRKLGEIEMTALIKYFELSYETGWNLMKDWLEYEGYSNIAGSRDAIRHAFTAGIVDDGESWMDMIRNRNRTAHIYNEDVAREIAGLILNRYLPAMSALMETMEQRSASGDE